MATSDEKYEAEVLDAHKLFQRALEIRLQLKTALEEHDAKRREYEAAKAKVKSVTESLTEIVTVLMEALMAQPTLKTLGAMVHDINEMQKRIREDRKRASHVGSSNQGQVADKPGTDSEPDDPSAAAGA
jgi:hypothetical protein